MDAVRAPDLAEPIVGWRYWRLDRGHRRLSSLTGHTQEWPPNRAFTAICRYARRDPSDFRYRYAGGGEPSHHDAPAEGCTCGVHAARDLKNLRARMLFGLGLMVVGEVSLWGKVIPGTRGVPVEVVAYREVAASPIEMIAVSLGTLGEKLSAVGEAISGFLRRRTAPASSGASEGDVGARCLH
jgi:hypothetical protein